jgi:hypothetical protein
MNPSRFGASVRRAQGTDAVRQSVHIYNSPGKLDATLEFVRAMA